MACARKTRARVNKYLDELKSLIANTLQPESIARLTKADVFELTVAHLKKLQSRNQPTIKPIPSDQDKFRGGCCRCVSLVSHSLASVPSISLTHHEKHPPLSPWVENGLQIPTFGGLRCSNNKGVVTRKDVLICKGLADYQSNQQV